MSDKLQAGKYFCTVAGQELRRSQAKNMMVVLRIEPMLFQKGTESIPVELEEDNTNKFLYYGTLTNKAAPFVYRELEALGFTGDKPSDVHYAEGGANIVGKEAWWELSYQDSKDGGDPFEKWRVFTPRESVAPVALSEGDLMKVDAMFGDVFAGTEGPATSSSNGEWDENDL